MNENDKPIVAFHLIGDEMHFQMQCLPERTYEDYGYLVVQMVRHIADAFKVSEGRVWDAVAQHRKKPQPAIRKPS
jgi:hypothetical protein